MRIKLYIGSVNSNNVIKLHEIYVTNNSLRKSRLLYKKISLYQTKNFKFCRVKGFPIQSFEICC